VALQCGAETPDAGVHGFLHYLMSGLADVGNFLGRDMVHRAVIERDQISRHLMSPLYGGHGRPPLNPATNASLRIRHSAGRKSHRTSAAGPAGVRCPGFAEIIHANHDANYSAAATPRTGSYSPGPHR